MAFVINCSVYTESGEKVLTDWTIVELSPKTATFREFFDGPVASLIPKVNQPVKLREARVGKAKLDCDPVALDLKMHDVMSVFGRFVKFRVD